MYKTETIEQEIDDRKEPLPVVRKYITGTEFRSINLTKDQKNEIKTHLQMLISEPNKDEAIEKLIDDIFLMGRNSLNQFQDYHIQILMENLGFLQLAPNILRILVQFTTLEELPPYFTTGYLHDKLKCIFESNEVIPISRAALLVGNGCYVSKEFQELCFQSPLALCIVQCTCLEPKDMAWLLRALLRDEPSQSEYFDIIAPAMLNIVAQDRHPGIKHFLHVLENASTQQVANLPEEFVGLLCEIANGSFKPQHQILALKILYILSEVGEPMIALFSSIGIDKLIGNLLCPPQPEIQQPDNDTDHQPLFSVDPEQYEMPSPYEEPPEPHFAVQATSRRFIPPLQSEIAYYCIQILTQWMDYQIHAEQLVATYANFPFHQLIHTMTSQNTDKMWVLLSKILALAGGDVFTTIFTAELATDAIDSIGCESARVNQALIEILLNGFDKLPDQEAYTSLIFENLDKSTMIDLSHDDDIGELAGLFLSRFENDFLA